MYNSHPSPHSLPSPSSLPPSHVTIISYMLQAVSEETMWCVCSATIPTCSCLLCSGCGETIRCRWSAGMEPDVHKLCSKCHVLLGMLALTDCDTTSFPFNKGKVSALSVLEAGFCPGLFHVLGRKTTCDGTLWMLDCPSFVHCTARRQTHRWKRRCITCTEK